MQRTPGLDVSHHQADAGPVDFAAAYAAGYRFCYVKLSEGESYRDPAGPKLWKAAKAAGLLVGGYHFVRFLHDGAAQARNLVAALAELGESDLPPAVDLETNEDDWKKPEPPTSERIRGVALDFVTELEHAIPWRALIYAGAPFSNESGLSVIAPDRDLWLAAYVSEARLKVPKGWPAWRIWQHSGKGRVPGITGDVDLNAFAGSEQDLKNWAQSQKRG
jgi:lysozyme